MGDMTVTVDDILSCDPEVVSGAVVFKGTRVPVAHLFDHLAEGVDLNEFLADFPTVTREQAKAALTLASDDIGGLYKWRRIESAA